MINIIGSPINKFAWVEKFSRLATTTTITSWIYETDSQENDEMTFCQTVPPYSKRAYDSSPVLSTDISLSRHPLTKSHVPEDGDFINGRSGRQNLWVCRAISRASVLCWGVGRPSCLLQELCCKDISERAHDEVGWCASLGSNPNIYPILFVSTV